MAIDRVGPTPSVEEALLRLSGADIAPSPVDQDVDEAAQQLYAVAPPLPGDPVVILAPDPSPVIAATPEPATPEPATPAPVAPPAQAQATFAAEAPPASALPPAASAAEPVTTDQLLETIRSSSQNAVRRLAAVTKPVTSSRPTMTSEATVAAGLPGIGELSREVERAVANAVAAASYHHDVEQRASTMASTIVADAAAEADRMLERANSERDTMLAGARSEAKQLLGDGKAQRDAIIARAEARAEGIVEQAEVELARRIRHIADTTGAIADIADAALGRLAAGTLTGEQLAQFVTALGTATERILAQQGTKE